MTRSVRAPLALSLLFVAGCTSPAGSAVVEVSPQCAQVAMVVAAHPDSFTVTPLRVRAIRVSRIEGVPPALYGKKIHIRMPVGANGLPAADSASFSPEIRDRSYLSALRASLSEYRFVPAMTEGCAIPSVYTTSITVGRPPL